VDDALRLVPVYAAARLIADSVASLPLQTYRYSGDVAVKVPPPALFRNPAGIGTLYDWVFACMTSLVLKGNAFGLIVNDDGQAVPSAIEWLDPDRVYIDERIRKYYLDGREIAAADLLHIRAFTLPGRIRGVSPLAMFASTIGAGQAMVDYSADWFRSGGFPPGTFRNTAVRVEQEEAEKIKRRLITSILQRAPLVFGHDWEYTPVSVPPEEAQFVEAAQLNATQIAAIYGIPPERIGGSRAGGSLTYANQEQDEIAWQTSGIRPWVVRLERALFDLLPSGTYVRFNLDAVIRTDLKTRHEVYAIDHGIGLRTIDEMRALEELPPLPKVSPEVVPTKGSQQ
jgi:HK97 family phage portal protein